VSTTTVAPVSHTGTTGPLQAPRVVGRLGWAFAALWLFFLANPLLEGWAHRDSVRGVLGVVLTLAFAAVYMALWVRAREDRTRLVHVSPRYAVTYVGALVVLGASVIACVGEPGLACVVYVSVGCVMVLPLRASAPIAVLLTVGTIALGAVEGWGSQLGNGFAVMAASVAVFGLRMVMSRNLDLVQAHEENARLAVDNERTRFARDLHDILGHSLTVITVKAELAGRLMDVDLDRARAEITDLERLSRDALADVRRAVQGYRDITLPGELVRARSALRSAEIEADLPNSTDEVPSELRELFAWTVREGVTNVIRHSGARRCAVVLTTSSAEVVDDGCAEPTPDGHGSGLAGLRERAADVGATVVTRQLEPGFSLRVVRA
jgi:two-component system, NarL family, sensor histidine kinase DesK